MSEISNDITLSGLVSTGKDLIAMLRDGMLLVLAVLLIGWPQTINSILVEAGFEEGSFAGMQWKAHLSQSDATLLKAQVVIADLREQNQNLNKALSEVKSQIPSEEVRADITRLDSLNSRLTESSAKVQEDVETTTSSNASFIQQAQKTLGTVATWGIVYGGDSKLADAQYEAQTIAPKLGLTNTMIYFRNNSYRTVATTTDRLQAEQFLQKAKERRKDAYVVNMSTWCPNPEDKEGYFECRNP